MTHPEQKARWDDRGRFRVPFIDLRAQRHAMGDALREALEPVLERQWFLFGPEVAAFEAAFSRCLEGRPVVGCASGTDALYLVLKALGVGAGDEVIVPAFTFAATAVAVLRTGARPLFCDVDGASRCMSRACLEAFRGRSPKALVAVHLFGFPAPMGEILAWARREGTLVVEDACQGHGASWGGRPVGVWGDGAAFSFYPGKNLGGVADGGVAVARDEAMAREMRVLANYGLEGGVLVRPDGINSRLSELAAASCRVKLDRLADWNARRGELATRYRKGLVARGLAERLRLPAEGTDGEAGWHALVVEVDEGRDELVRAMLEAGVEVRIHYDRALVDHPVFAGWDSSDPCSVSRDLARRVLSLPLYPEMGEDGVDAVLAALAGSFPSSPSSTSRMLRPRRR